ncbi:hypothetical protein MMC21_005277 [Puttea exsequens]|nr:hypothetical protein [Puttea exsequens]
MAKYIQLTLSLSSFIAIAISSVIAVLFSYFNPFFPFKLSTFNPSITLAPHSLIMLNQASWIPAAKAIVYLDDKTEIPKPEPGEVLVKVRCIAFSPIDSKIQKFGTHPIPYPTILGTSYAGTIESVGEGSITSFKPGDTIATIRPPPQIGNPHFGAFQKYALATIHDSAKIPAAVPPAAAAATILNLSAVVAALNIHLKLSLPPLSSAPHPNNTNEKVLIYGGSSSCGGLAVRYAVTAGYTVTTTSSPRNRDFVSSLGPSYIIDHTLPPASILASLKAQGPFAAIFDTIGLAPVTDILCSYLATLPDGGAYNTLIPPMGNAPIPANVERKFAPYNFAFQEEEHEGVRRWFYEEYLPKGLESGLIVPTRQEVVQGGLGEVQRVLDLMMEGGVSGRKLVMDPWA